MGIWYTVQAQWRSSIGNLRPKYVPYNHMDPSKIIKTWHVNSEPSTLGMKFNYHPVWGIRQSILRCSFSQATRKGSLVTSWVSESNIIMGPLGSSYGTYAYVYAMMGPSV